MEIAIPHHIAFIPDGNRRWARANKRSIFTGYKNGAAKFRTLVEAAFNRGVRYVTFWSASSDNLRKRTPHEVEILVQLLKRYTQEMLEANEIAKNQVQVRFIGKGREIVKDAELNALITALEEKTKNFKKHRLTILFGYDGKEEMLSAVEKLKLQEIVREGDLCAALWTNDLPPVDLVVRTGGEPHNSAGFMMWHTANSQLYFTEKLWPEFNVAELDTALADFSQRGRRLGK